MHRFTELRSRQGIATLVGYDFDSSFENLAKRREDDSFIVSTEDGFSPLGANRSFLSSDLGIPENDISQLADWNRFENPMVSLVVLQSRKKNSLLHGVVLAASESSESYKRFAEPRYGHPYRDFYYNVTYEAIAYASANWKAQRLALSHLSGSGTFHEDIATCNAEALAHYCDITPSAKIESFMFVGCCISQKHLAGIARLNAEAKTGQHHPISTNVVNHGGYDLVHLEWGHDALRSTLRSTGRLTAPA